MNSKKPRSDVPELRLEYFYKNHLSKIIIILSYKRKIITIVALASRLPDKNIETKKKEKKKQTPIMYKKIQNTFYVIWSLKLACLSVQSRLLYVYYRSKCCLVTHRSNAAVSCSLTEAVYWRLQCHLKLFLSFLDKIINGLWTFLLCRKMEETVCFWERRHNLLYKNYLSWWN